MATPTTELDPRFSEPGAAPTTWEEARTILDSAELAWITTVRADGRPHTTPLVAVWLDDAVHFCTGPDEQKAVNLRNDARVTITIGSNRWDEGLDVVVEGDAEQLTDEMLLRRLADAWRGKWDGRWQFDVADGSFRHEHGNGQAVVFRVVPTTVLAFGTGSFTRHRFAHVPRS